MVAAQAERCITAPCMWRRTALAAALLTLSSNASGQDATPAGTKTTGPTTVRVAASERYAAGSAYRALMGGGYRDLWEAKIELPVLDLAKEGGRLTPKGRFGGLQSAVLGFKGANGLSYSFRGTDKDPSAVLDPMLRESALKDLVQDQMAAQHPGGPLVAGALSIAAGVLTIRERMVVIPDDPALGEYRKEFAGMVGSFYQYPTPAKEGRPGFANATAIIDHEELYQRLSRSPADQVDAEAYLRARLFDLLVGDFDRHRKQWRWAKIPGEPKWQPIPEDRDQAFVRYDGVGQRLGYIYVPILQCYGPDYPSMRGLVFHGWEQDRWLLTGLGWPEWKAIIADLGARLTNDVIDAAIHQLPAEYVALDGARLRTAIRGRRDNLLEGGRAFYDHLAGAVNVQATDAAELVQATWSEDGKLRVEVRERAEASTPVFARTFDPADTDDLRIYLRGGDDHVIVKGPPGGIQLRVIAGAGHKTLDDSAGGDTIFYDAPPSHDIRRGPGTEVVDDGYTVPKSSSGFLDVELPPREWGADVLPFPALGYEPGVGLVVGLGMQVTEYGFRKHPWSRSHAVGAAFATGTLLPTAGYSGKYRFENSNLLAELDVTYSGNAVIRYHGMGNETPNDAADDFYGVVNHQATLSPGVSWSTADHRLRMSAGVQLGYFNTQTEDEARLISLEQPYGFGSFLQTSAFGRVVVDLRRSEFTDAPMALPFHDNVAAGYATSGVLLDVRADVAPPLFDAEQAWGSMDASVAGYLGLGDGRVVLAARVGERLTWGEVPYFGSAFIGGAGFFSGGATARGFIAQRYAGEASVYSNADVRLFLFRFNMLVPTDFGITGFGDLGRVIVLGEGSNLWHPSGGGGIWFAPLARTNTITFSVAGSEENALFYVRAGFHY
jgi:hypothetical protein